MKKQLSLLAEVRAYIASHKIVSIIIIILIIGGGYYSNQKKSAANSTLQYVLSPARIGTITQTVTGSGQVLAENQLDVTSEVSGKIQSINVTVGQHLNKGDLIATLDSHDASISLESARIAYAKLVKPAKTGDLTNAQNSVAKSYADAFNAASSLYLDLPNIVSGTKDMFYGSNGFLSDQRSSYLISTARSYRQTAADSYDKASLQYEKALQEYKSLSRASATSSINDFLSHSYDLAKTISLMLQNTQNALTYISNAQPDYNASAASAAATNVGTWSNQVNSDLASIISAQNTIASSENSLSTLIEGAEDLDIQSQRLSLRQAEENYAKYFIRAPFDGVIGRIPVSVYSQASASTIIATIVGDRKIANISLNEVDAAKVKAGQPVKISFDAIDGLNATGTVDRVDLVGTVSQGVVSYTIRIAINTNDDRIKPGMSMNVSIVTKEKLGVLIIPTSAIKTQGNKKYVETLAVDPNALRTSNGQAVQRRMNATNTNELMASTTLQFRNGSTNDSTARTITTTSETAPTQVVIITGDSDDTNTEIINGLERGQMAVTRTISAGTATTATPNIFSAVGGNRNNTGANRAVVRPN